MLRIATLGGSGVPRDLQAGRNLCGAPPYQSAKPFAEDPRFAGALALALLALAARPWKPV
jgi:hypothetical protein